MSDLRRLIVDERRAIVTPERIRARDERRCDYCGREWDDAVVCECGNRGGHSE